MILRFPFAFVLLAAPALANDDSMLTLPIRFHITQGAAALAALTVPTVR